MTTITERQTAAGSNLASSEFASLEDAKNELRKFVQDLIQDMYRTEKKCNINEIMAHIIKNCCSNKNYYLFEAITTFIENIKDRFEMTANAMSNNFMSKTFDEEEHTVFIEPPKEISQKTQDLLAKMRASRAKRNAINPTPIVINVDSTDSQSKRQKEQKVSLCIIKTTKDTEREKESETEKQCRWINNTEKFEGLSKENIILAMGRETILHYKVRLVGTNMSQMYRKMFNL